MKRASILIPLALLLLTVTGVLASEYSGAEYQTTVVISNNGSATGNETAVYTLSTADMITSGMLNATATDATQIYSGSDMPVMPGYSTNPWVTFIESIDAAEQRNTYLYSGNVTGGLYTYFPGDEGMSTADSATMEPGDNFTVEQTGWLDASQTGANLVYKPRAYREYIGASGNVTAAILTTDNVSPTGYVDTGSGWTLEANAYDVDTGTRAESTSTADSSWTEYLELTVTGERTTSVWVYTDDRGGTGDAEVDAYYSGAWDNIFTGDITPNTWTELPIGSTQTVTAMRIRFYNESGGALVYYVWEAYFTNETESVQVSVSGIVSDNQTVEVVSENITPWLTGWDNRIRVDIDADKIDAALTHYPILLALSASAGYGGDDVTAIFDELGANYLKLAVTEDDGTTELYVEVEAWDNGGKTASLWVSASGWSISDSVDTTIYIYYDNDHADNTARVGVPNDAVAQNVWDTYYVLVDHMQDGATDNTTYDSTSNNNDGTKTASNEPNETTGQIGNAQIFDGSDDKINTGNDASLQTDNYTIEALLKTTYNNSTYKGIVSKVQAYAIGLRNGKLACYDWAGSAWRLNGVDELSDDAWHAVAVAGDNTTSQFYVDGETDGTSFAFSINNHTGDLAIGSGTPASEYLAATIDEVRVSNTERAAAWLKATYYTGTDNLVDYIPNAEAYLVEYAIDFKLYVNSVLQDRTLGASVPDVSDNWTFAEGGSFVYLDSQIITVDGDEVQSIVWEYGDTFTDGSGNGNDATPSFRTTGSNANVTAEVTAQVSLLSTSSPSTTEASGWTMITDNATDPGMYAEGSINFPGGAEIDEMAQSARLPTSAFLIVIALFTAGLAGAGVYALSSKSKVGIRGSLLAMVIAVGLVLIIWGRIGAISYMAAIPFGIIAIVLLMFRNPLNPTQ